MFYAQRRAMIAGAVTTLALVLTAHAGTIFVDTNATGVEDGADWDNAFTELQDALADAAGSGGTVDEIRVAGGTYAPDQGTVVTAGDRFATFQLLDGVAILGGFAGAGAPNPDARDLVTHETILSGDLNGDDAGAPDGDNSLHVVTSSNVDASAVLDGVTITGGNANVSGNNTGGGILNLGGSPTIRSCRIEGNATSYNGAGMYTDAGDPRLTDCLFAGNVAASQGGAVRSWHSGSPQFIRCRFEANTGSNGGAIQSQNEGAGTPEVVACIFIGNVGGGDGGAIDAVGGINITNSLFTGNSALFRGGAISAEVRNGGASISSCTFSANTAVSGSSGNYGGAVYSNCGFSTTCGTNTRLINCIAWGDAPDEIAGSQHAVTFSDVQGGLFGAGNIDADPQFIDSDLRVASGSPVIDAGDNGGVPADAGDVDDDGDLAEEYPIDLDGNPRVVGASVDMGVYEDAGLNSAPDADAIVQQLTGVGDTAIVRLDASGSTDAEDPQSSLTFEWFVDGVSVCVGDASTCAVVEVALPIPGTYAFDLSVTDTGNAVGTAHTDLSLEPAALALVEVEKLKVEFGRDPGRVKLSGSVGLPFGVDYAEVAPLALLELRIAELPVIDPVPIMLEASSNGRKWKYRDDDAPFGITKLDVDWKGARFRFKEHGFPIEFKSEIIGSSETVIAMKYKTDDLDGTVWIDFGGLASIEIDGDGVVTGDVPITEEKAGREVTLALPFALVGTIDVNITGGAQHAFTVADHYETSVGRFKLEVEFDDALYPYGAGTSPTTVDLSFAAGDQFYPGETVLDALSIRIDGDKWKERK